MKRGSYLKRMTPIRRVAVRRGGSGKEVRRELDRLARILCLRRAGHRCEKCGGIARLQVHHVYSRRIMSLRWEPLNLIVLCSGDHLWWHGNPLDAARWFVETFGQERTDRLRLIRGSRRRQDAEGLLVALRLQEKSAEGGGPHSTA